jgi:hypothetical protein
MRSVWTIRHRHIPALSSFHHGNAISSARWFNFDAGDKMDEQHSDLDELQAAYKAAVEKWVTAIRKEEALASVNHSVAEVDLWEDAGFQEDAMRNVVKESKAKYEDALREKFFGF